MLQQQQQQQCVCILQEHDATETIQNFICCRVTRNARDKQWCEDWVFEWKPFYNSFLLIVLNLDFIILNDTRVVQKVSRLFFVRALLLIVHTWNSSPLRSNLLRLHCTCCTVPTTSERPHGSPLVWACQWPSSQPLSAPQLSHNDSV